MTKANRLCCKLGAVPKKWLVISKSLFSSTLVLSMNTYKEGNIRYYDILFLLDRVWHISIKACKFSFQEATNL